MVDRRWWGAAVIVVVLLAAIVVPNFSARRVAGEPVVGILPVHPVVGDCVSSMTDPWEHFEDPAPQIDDVFSYPTATIGSCADPIVGEVVSVSLGAAPVARISATDYLSQGSNCRIDSITYTGSIPPVVQTAAGGPGLLWSPQLNFHYTTVGPTPAQRAAGQQWSACVIGSSRDTPYVGRLQEVLTDGRLPPTFGYCLTSADPNFSVQVPCDRPHAAELVGTTGLGPAGVPSADAQQACSVYAGRALRTADPTRGGALTVQVNEQGATVSRVVPATADLLIDTFLECIVVAPSGEQFNQSLIGVGDGPLPIG